MHWCVYIIGVSNMKQFHAEPTAQVAGEGE